jgi:PEGA domain
VRPLLALAALLLVTAQADATPRLALVRLEPLGLDAERAARLEGLFRIELERLTGGALAPLAAIDAVMAKDPKLRSCTAELGCLSAIGKKLGVAQIAAGNVGELGDSYVVNLKLVDVESQREVRRVSRPLRGNADELIDAVRVAAYELAAPEKLLGSLAILSDVAGAEVLLDKKPVGRTPMTKPLEELKVGPHELRLRARGYSDFAREVDVRFQKETQVVVRMIASPGGVAMGPAELDNRPRPAPVPWYSSTWTYVGVGVGAVVIGFLVGKALVPDPIIDCGEEPSACGR